MKSLYIIFRIKNFEKLIYLSCRYRGLRLDGYGIIFFRHHTASGTQIFSAFPILFDNFQQFFSILRFQNNVLEIR